MVGDHDLLELKLFVQSPQRSCCRIEDWRRDKIDIHVGACREGESLLGAD